MNDHPVPEVPGTPPVFGHPGELAPPAGLILRSKTWMVWPLGNPERAIRLAAGTAREAVESYSRLASELAGLRLVCVDADGRRLTHWEGRRGPAAGDLWHRCRRPGTA